jgi:hypothetical protein
LSLAVVRTVAVGSEPTGLATSRRDVWVVGAEPFAAAVSVRRIDSRFDEATSPLRLGNVVAGWSQT